MCGIYKHTKYILINLFQMTVIQGDLVKIAADAIVHPTSSSFYMGGEVGSAIERAGGKDFKKEVDELYKSNGALDTAGGNLLLPFI